MRLDPRSTTSLALILSLAILSGACTPSGDTYSSGTTEILWDSWGVPHIYAPDAEGAFHAFGWAQARNHGDRILRLMGESRGRGAEYWGEDNLALDRNNRLLNLRTCLRPGSYGNRRRGKGMG